MRNSGEIAIRKMHPTLVGPCQFHLGRVVKAPVRVTDIFQASEKLRSECFAIHDALRDPEMLNTKVVERLGRLDTFGKLFTVCQILCQPFGGQDSNGAKTNAIRPSAGPDLDSKIEKYELEKSDWTKLKLKPSKLNRILLCKE